MDAHHTIVFKVFQHFLFCISTRTSEGGGVAMSAKLEQGVCRRLCRSFSIEQTTSNAANISGSIRSEVLNTHKKIRLRSLSATMSLFSVSSRGSDLKKVMHCKS